MSRRDAISLRIALTILMLVMGEDGKEVFVHYSGIVKDGFKALNEKQEVEYELGEGSKGIQAINEL